MPRTVSTRRWAAQVDRTDSYPDDLLPELQHTLAALAGVEVRYEAAREHLEHESGSRFLWRLRHTTSGSESPIFSGWSS
jgi:hypothetical protein